MLAPLALIFAFLAVVLFGVATCHIIAELLIMSVGSGENYMRASLLLEIISVLDLLLLEVAHVSILRVDQILHLLHLLMVLVLAALELSL